MIDCSISDFRRRWPDTFVPYAFSKSVDGVPTNVQSLLGGEGLPRGFEMRGYVDMEVSFPGIVSPLQEIWARALEQGYKLGKMPLGYSRFWHLGDIDAGQTGGWVCVDENSGHLYVVDLDQDDPVYLMNSTFDSFVTTLAHFLDWSGKVRGESGDLQKFAEALRNQTRIPSSELEPFWLNFVDATLDAGETHFKVVILG